jgi:polyisoprenoid-binding protein YceI
MKILINKTILFIAFALFVTTSVNAQTLKINPKSSFVIIQGSSNLHAWESKTQQINGQMTVNYSSKQVQSMVVDIPVKSIKSGEKLMDSKTYDAFNADKNPNIQFRLVEVNNLQITPSNINVTVTGNLTLAGVTKRITLKAVGKPKGESFIFTGNVSMKMTDFKISPPTAMMGMLKVGDAINLKFEIAVDGVQLSQL